MSKEVEVMNNHYFSQNNSGVVLVEKGISWHFFSCMYYVKGLHLCFYLLVRSFCLGFVSGHF